MSEGDGIRRSVIRIRSFVNEIVRDYFKIAVEILYRLFRKICYLKHIDPVVIYEETELFRYVQHIIQGPAITPGGIPEIKNQRYDRIAMFLRKLSAIGCPVVANDP